MIKAVAPVALWAQVGAVAQLDSLTWGAFLSSLVPVTIGNIIGGSVLVGGVYWFVYLRKGAPAGE